MSALTRGVIVALVHVLIVLSLGGKLLYDRATRPRVWVDVMPYDPSLPVRGRYLALQVVVDASDFPQPRTWEDVWTRRSAALELRAGRLVARPSRVSTVRVRFVEPPGRRPDRNVRPSDPVKGPLVAVLDEPLLFFIPEHAKEPAMDAAAGPLRVEVTVPRSGPPRPIRLNR